MPKPQLKNPVKFIHLILIVASILIIGAYNPIISAFEYGLDSFQFATAKENFIIENMYIPLSIALAIGIIILTMVSNNDSWNDFVEDRDELEEKPSDKIKFSAILFVCVSLFFGWSFSQLVPFVYGLGFTASQNSALFINNKSAITVKKIKTETLTSSGRYGGKPMHRVMVLTKQDSWLIISNSSDTVFDLKGKKDLAIYQTISAGGNMRKTCVASQSWEELNKIPRCYSIGSNYK